MCIENLNTYKYSVIMKHQDIYMLIHFVMSELKFIFGTEINLVDNIFFRKNVKMKIFNKILLKIMYNCLFLQALKCVCTTTEMVRSSSVAFCKHSLFVSSF